MATQRENERFHNLWLGFFCVLISSVIIIIDWGFIAITQPRVDYGVSRMGGISSQDRFSLQNVRALLMWILLALEHARAGSKQGGDERAREEVKSRKKSESS